MCPASLKQVLLLCRRPLSVEGTLLVMSCFPRHHTDSRTMIMIMTATFFSNLQSSSLQSEPNMFHLRLQVTDSIRFEAREIKINKIIYETFLLNLGNVVKY